MIALETANRLKAATVLTLCLLAGLLLFTQAFFLLRGITAHRPSSVDTVPLHTAYTSRIAADNPTDLSITTMTMRFAHGVRASRLVVAPAQDPMASLLGLRLCSPEVGGALMLVGPEAPGESDLEHVAGLVNEDQRAVILGEVPGEITRRLATHFELEHLPGSSTELAIAVDTYLERETSPSERVILVPADDLRFALPAATWVALTGDALFPVGRDQLCPDLAGHLRDRQSQLGPELEMNLYLLAPRSLATSSLLETLNDYGQPIRVTGYDPYEHSLSLAQFYDAGTQFGWDSGSKRSGDYAMLVGNPENPENVTAIAQIFSDTQYGPTILTQTDRLPATVETFLWTTRPHWTVQGTEGPHNFTWIAGDLDTVSWSIQRQIDHINELVPYNRQGFGGVEALSLAWLFTSWLGAAWIWIHATVRRPLMRTEVRVLWILSSLAIGIFAILAYYLAQRGEEVPPAAGKEKISPAASALTADVKTTSLVAAGISVSAAFLILLGRPSWIVPGSFFFAGNTVVRGFVVGYLLVLAISLLAVQPALITKGSEKYRRLLQDSLPAVLSAVTVTAIFYSVLFWFINWDYLAFPPGPDDLAWWGVAGISALLVAVITYPLHYWLVASQVDKGTLE